MTSLGPCSIVDVVMTSRASNANPKYMVALLCGRDKENKTNSNHKVALQHDRGKANEKKNHSYGRSTAWPWKTGML